MQSKEITIYDIAKKLNFAPSTVSRALNDHKSISAKTIKKIKEAATEMGYRPNSLAASLRNNRCKTIGVMVPTINRPFMGALISGVEERARKAGYNVIISQSNETYKNEVDNAKALYDSRVSGLIASLSMETTNYDHFQQYVDLGIPITFVDRVPEGFNAYMVMIDNYGAAYKATQHLIEQGCKRIAHFAGAHHISIYRQRQQGYLDALRHHNMPVSEELIIELNIISGEEGKLATEQLLSLDNPPDGIFSSNDTAAISAVIHAKKMGLRIPEDLAVVGFNDDPIAGLIEPGLSSITHPAYDMGRIAARRILEHPTNKTTMDATEITILNTELIVRGSSKRKIDQNKKILK